MAISVISKGRGLYYVYVTVYNPKNIKKPWQRRRTVGAGTRWPCGSKEEARRLYGEPWEAEFISTRDGNPAAKGSLTFGDLRKQYIASNPSLQHNILGILNGPISELDGAIRDRFRDSYLDWIDLKEQQDIRKHPDSPAKFRSPETMRCYKRYVKVILNSSDDDEWIRQIRKIEIGKGKPREITIQPEHVEKLEEFFKNDDEFGWFWMHVDFAWKCPIRPFDQFNTLRHASITQVPLSLAYKPHKTYERKGEIKGVWAVPFILPEHRRFFTNPPIQSEFVFPNEDGSCLYPDQAHAYYADIIKKVCKKAGVPTFQFYQLRHVAVSRLIAEGKSDSEIMKATGWSSREMLDHYHVGNPVLIEYFREKSSILGNGSRKDGVNTFVSH